MQSMHACSSIVGLVQFFWFIFTSSDLILLPITSTKIIILLVIVDYFSLYKVEDLDDIIINTKVNKAIIKLHRVQMDKMII